MWVLRGCHAFCEKPRTNTPARSLVCCLWAPSLICPFSGKRRAEASRSRAGRRQTPDDCPAASYTVTLPELLFGPWVFRF